MDTKAFKRSLHSSEQYYRKGFGYSEQATAMLQLEYQSNLIQNLRNNGYTLLQGDVTIHLAQAMGFCWGVERGIALAYETRQQFPFERIWITNEIIHNPLVNQNMQDIKVKFIPVNQQGQKDFSVVNKEDVVILPAFGASFEEMQLLKKKGCKVMDTTCPWVSKVWNNVEKHKQRNYTSIIHGKYKHEETIATSSFAVNITLILLNVLVQEIALNIKSYIPLWKWLKTGYNLVKLSLALPLELLPQIQLLLMSSRKFLKLRDFLLEFRLKVGTHSHNSSIVLKGEN